MKKEFITVLLKVQKEMPVVGRTTDAFKYKYAPIEVVWDKVGKILSDNGFVIVNKIDENGITTTALHELGEMTSTIAFSNLALKPQDRGSEITYARRYNLCAIFNIIIAGEDDDAIVTKEAKEKDYKAEVDKINSIPKLKAYYEKHKDTYKSQDFNDYVAQAKVRIENDIPVIQEDETL
jgi:hypothetical protein